MELETNHNMTRAKKMVTHAKVCIMCSKSGISFAAFHLLLHAIIHNYPFFKMACSLGAMAGCATCEQSTLPDATLNCAISICPTTFIQFPAFDMLQNLMIFEVFQWRVDEKCFCWLSWGNTFLVHVWNQALT